MHYTSKDFYATLVDNKKIYNASTRHVAISFRCILQLSDYNLSRVRYLYANKLPEWGTPGIGRVNFPQ